MDTVPKPSAAMFKRKTPHPEHCEMHDEEPKPHSDVKGPMGRAAIEGSDNETNKLEDIWNGPLNDDFFRAFGEPEKITFNEKGQATLTYPKGNKLAWIEDMVSSTHWGTETTPTGETNITNIDKCIALNVARTVDGIPDPDAIIWERVARDVKSSRPILQEAVFSKLPATIQQKVKDIIHDTTIMPIEEAKQRIDEVTKNGWFDELRGGIADLRSSAEAHYKYWISRDTIYWGESPDGMRPAGERMEKVDHTALVVGNSSFNVPKGNNQDAETLRKELLAKQLAIYEENLQRVERLIRIDRHKPGDKEDDYTTQQLGMDIKKRTESYQVAIDALWHFKILEWQKEDDAALASREADIAAERQAKEEAEAEQKRIKEEEREARRRANEEIAEARRQKWQAQEEINNEAIRQERERLKPIIDAIVNNHIDTDVSTEQAQRIAQWAEQAVTAYYEDDVVDVLNRAVNAPYGRARQIKYINGELPNASVPEYGRAQDLTAHVRGAIAWIESGFAVKALENDEQDGDESTSAKVDDQSSKDDDSQKRDETVAQEQLEALQARFGGK